MIGNFQHLWLGIFTSSFCDRHGRAGCGQLIKPPRLPRARACECSPLVFASVGAVEEVPRHPIGGFRRGGAHFPMEPQATYPFPAAIGIPSPRPRAGLDTYGLTSMYVPGEK